MADKKTSVEKEIPPPTYRIPENLSGLHRIVARQQLKDRVKFLEDVIKTHKPLIEAMRVTQSAYQKGVMEGIRQVAAAEREREEKAQTPVPTEATPDIPVSKEETV